MRIGIGAVEDDNGVGSEVGGIGSGIRVGGGDEIEGEAGEQEEGEDSAEHEVMSLAGEAVGEKVQRSIWRPS